MGASDEEKDLDVAGTVRTFGRRLLTRDVLTLVIVVCCILWVFFKGKDALAAEIKAGVDAGVKEMKKPLTDLAEEQSKQKRDVLELGEQQYTFQKDVKEELKETQRDMRALYRYIKTGEKQERLEKPRDGGE